jgi:methyl coenzyme M reductase beta subunit
MTNPIPTDMLEQRAASQRQRLHDSVSELRSTVRQRLDVQKAARAYLWQASAAAGLLAFALGYAIGGAFTD